MEKLALLTTTIILLSIGVSAEISEDLQNELDELGPTDRIEVLVQTGPSMTDRHVNQMNQQAEVRNRYDLFDGVHLELPVPAVQNLAERDFVRSVEPNYEMELFLSESTKQVGADTVWDYESTGNEIGAAVLDTGVQYDHSALNVVEEVDFTGEGTSDLNGHGTHVAGIVASQDTDNLGVAYDADIYNVKVLDEDGRGTGSDLLNGMEWTVENNIPIAVLSLGAEVDSCDGEDIISNAVDNMVDNGVFVAVAAGNEGPEEESLTIPGCNRDGITVGSVDKNDNLADYSSRGPTADGRSKPDIVAPGTSIESTWNDGGFNTLSGTSMATPHVAGQAALLLEEDSSLTPNELKNAIMEASTDLGLNENNQGAGRINVSESFFAVSDKEKEDSEESEEETEENGTGDETEEETEEDAESSSPDDNNRASARVRFGPDSNLYGLRVASDRAAVALRIKTRESVMEQRAKEARHMMESGNKNAAERALEEMRRTSGNKENATKDAEETLEKVMQDSPEEAKEGLRNALKNVEGKRDGATQRQAEREAQSDVDQSPEDRRDSNEATEGSERNLDDTKEKSSEEGERDSSVAEREERVQERDSLEEKQQPREQKQSDKEANLDEEQDSEVLEEQDSEKVNETKSERQNVQTRRQDSENSTGRFFQDMLGLLQ